MILQVEEELSALIELACCSIADRRILCVNKTGKEMGQHDQIWTGQPSIISIKCHTTERFTNLGKLKLQMVVWF